MTSVACVSERENLPHLPSPRLAAAAIGSIPCDLCHVYALISDNLDYSRLYSALFHHITLCEKPVLPSSAASPNLNAMLPLMALPHSLINYKDKSLLHEVWCLGVLYVYVSLCLF